MSYCLPCSDGVTFDILLIVSLRPLSSPGSCLYALIFPSKSNLRNSSVIQATPTQRCNTPHAVPAHALCTFVCFLMLCTVFATHAPLSALLIVHPSVAKSQQRTIVDHARILHFLRMALWDGTVSMLLCVTNTAAIPMSLVVSSTVSAMYPVHRVWTCHLLLSWIDTRQPRRPKACTTQQGSRWVLSFAITKCQLPGLGRGSYHTTDGYFQSLGTPKLNVKNCSINNTHTNGMV